MIAINKLVAVNTALMLVSACMTVSPQNPAKAAAAANSTGIVCAAAESDFVGKWFLFKAIQYGEVMFDDGLYPDGTPVENCEGNLYDLHADGTGEHVFYHGDEVYSVTPLTWSCSGNTLTMDIYHEELPAEMQHITATYQLVDGILESHEIVDGYEDSAYLRRTDHDPRQGSVLETTLPATETTIVTTQTTAAEATFVTLAPGTADSRFIGKWLFTKQTEDGRVSAEDGFYTNGKPLEFNLYDLRDDGTGAFLGYNNDGKLTESPLTWSSVGDTVNIHQYFSNTDFSIEYQYKDGALVDNGEVFGTQYEWFYTRTEYDRRETAETTVTSAAETTTSTTEATTSTTETTGTEAAAPTAGDFTGDGKLEVADAVCFCRLLSESGDADYSAETLAAADLDGDGLLTLLDVRRLLMLL